MAAPSPDPLGNRGSLPSSSEVARFRPRAEKTARNLLAKAGEIRLDVEMLDAVEGLIRARKGSKAGVPKL